MTTKFALPALAAAALILPSCATVLQAAWTPPTHDPAKVPAGTYKVEPYHTQILFSVLHMGLTNYSGVFSQASGSLTLVPNDPAKSQVQISVPVDSVSTTSTKLDGELKSADWLDAKTYPAMQFVSTNVTPTGAGSADIAGTLTLHGISKPLTLHASFIGAGPNILTKAENVGFQLTGELKRSDFGIAKYLPLIGDDVRITIAAAFEK